MGRFVVEKSVEVNAPAGAVWEQMVAVLRWPEWKPFIQKARIGGGYESLTNGSTLKFSILIGGPAAIPLSVKVTEFNIPSRLAWSGGVPGLFFATHSFDFQEKQGQTVVTSREEFSGALLGLVKLMLSEEDFEKLHQEWVQAIKKRLEKGVDPAPEAEHPHH
jgi:hypothetical protein